VSTGGVGGTGTGGVSTGGVGGTGTGGVGGVSGVSTGGVGGRPGQTPCDELCVAKAQLPCDGFTHEACVYDCLATEYIAQLYGCEDEWDEVLVCGRELNSSGFQCLSDGHVDFDYNSGGCSAEYLGFVYCLSG
jgi:hypothetical protein